jgi:hypothetical protein
MDCDIPFLLKETGKWIEIAGSPRFKGIIDIVGKDQLQTLQISGVSGTVKSVFCQTTALPAGLKNRTALIVDGDPMMLRDSQPEGDGAITVLYCSDA